MIEEDGGRFSGPTPPPFDLQGYGEWIYDVKDDKWNLKIDGIMCQQPISGWTQVGVRVALRETI